MAPGDFHFCVVAMQVVMIFGILQVASCRALAFDLCNSQSIIRPRRGLEERSRAGSGSRCGKHGSISSFNHSQDADGGPLTRGRQQALWDLNQAPLGGIGLRRLSQRGGALPCQGTTPLVKTWKHNVATRTPTTASGHTRTSHLTKSTRSKPRLGVCTALCSRKYFRKPCGPLGSPTKK